MKACAGSVTVWFSYVFVAHVMLYSELEKVTDGRRSFPSGHSSEAWAGMTFLSLFLAGVTGAWCLNRVATAPSAFNSRMVRICLTLAPIAFATWVGVSRLEDYVRAPISGSAVPADRHLSDRDIT